MITPFVAKAWKEGLGPDDREPLAAALAHELDPDLRVFAAWFDLLVELAVPVPPAPPEPSARVVQTAARLAFARIGRDAAALQTIMGELADALAALPEMDPRGLAARAWADLALGDVAVMMADEATARRRFEAVYADGRPIALRITAALRMVGLAMSRVDLTPAQKWARRAVSLAAQHERPAHAARARIVLGMLEHVAGDPAAMQKSIEPLLARPDTALLARLVLASAQPASVAMPLFAEGVRKATETGDLATYMLCILIGGRRYVAEGLRADALVTLSAGIVELRKVAPPLAAGLEAERAAWQASWGPEAWAAAEAEALASLDG